MKALITIVMDGAAFWADETPASELARILELLAKDVKRGTDNAVLHDINGNPVGSFRIEGGAA